MRATHSSRRPGDCSPRSGKPSIWQAGYSSYGCLAGNKCRKVEQRPQFKLTECQTAPSHLFKMNSKSWTHMRTGPCCSLNHMSCAHTVMGEVSAHSVAKESTITGQGSWLMLTGPGFLSMLMVRVHVCFWECVCVCVCHRHLAWHPCWVFSHTLVAHLSIETGGVCVSG